MALYTLKYFLRLAENYMHLIMIDSMRHKKYTSQIGEKISNFGNHDFQKFISVNTCINKHLGRIWTHDLPFTSPILYFYHWAMVLFNQIDWWKKILIAILLRSVLFKSISLDVVRYLNVKLQERDVFVKFCLIFNLIITCNNEDAFIDNFR